MARATNSPASRRRRNRRLKLARGFRGNRKLFRQATEAVDRAMVMATEHRKLRKRDFRSLWIVRINAAARANGLSYSVFMRGLSLAGVAIDRKMLADMAVREKDSFQKLAELAKAQVN